MKLFLSFIWILSKIKIKLQYQNDSTMYNQFEILQNKLIIYYANFYNTLQIKEKQGKKQDDSEHL